MLINIAHLGSDPWFNYKSDIISGLYCALVGLGHDVVVTHNRIDPSRFNILLGADWVQSTALVQQFREIPRGFAVFEVEHLKNDTVNSRTNFNWGLYLELIDAAAFVFSPYTLNGLAYAKHGYGGKFASFKWGFYPELVDPRYKGGMRKVYACCFVGMAKGSRQALLQAFAKRYGEEFQLVTTSDPFCLKDFKLMQSRWGLSLRNELDRVESINPFRIFHHLANGIPVLANHREDPDGYSEFAVFQPTESIVEFASIDQSGRRQQWEELARHSLLIENLKPVFGKI